MRGSSSASTAWKKYPGYMGASSVRIFSLSLKMESPWRMFFLCTFPVTHPKWLSDMA